MTNHEAAKAELLAQLSTETIIEQRIILENKANLTDDEKMLSIWFATEAENRHPGMPDAIDAIIDADLEIGYGDALKKAWELVSA